MDNQTNLPLEITVLQGMYNWLSRRSYRSLVRAVKGMKLTASQYNVLAIELTNLSLKAGLTPSEMGLGLRRVSSNLQLSQELCACLSKCVKNLTSDGYPTNIPSHEEWTANLQDLKNRLSTMTKDSTP